MRIFLDNFKEAPIGWVHAYTAEEAIRLLANFNVTDLSMDNEVNNGDAPGYYVLNWIENQILYSHYKPPKIHTHATNANNFKRMSTIIDSINALVENRYANQC